MLSNIEQAVLDLLATKQSITVPNVFSAYMRIAGHDMSDTEKAVVTFERALDKHAVRPDDVQSPMIEKLRNQYWYTKLGGRKDGDGECCVCEHCGRLQLKDKSNQRTGACATTATAQAEEHEPQRAKTVKAKKNKRRVCRKVRPDPHAPSTSTARL
ncbi:hypothetical protein LshimejAT787_2300160 [Lyophyllum shimeji]|uniref:Uncharacterized protein n=1 Tax=Lyophyllum shimeji TaxID=47721 RepID=A0A9P3Q179_LYOSH|nr:hypothetical protein LshimejAT787_2300160 [Lyophyllum shimeji]